VIGRTAQRVWRWLIDKDVKLGNDAPDQEAWRTRYSVVGKFQARYLFLVLVLGVFFIALDTTLAGKPACLRPDALGTEAGDECYIEVPVIELKLGVVYVWTWGAPVLFLLLLAILGSLRAALKAKVLSGLNQVEPYDEHPNVIDMAVYTYPDLRGPWAIFGVLFYLIYLSVFWIEALYLGYRLLDSDPRPPLSKVSISLAAVLAALATPRLAKFWVKRLYEMFRRS